MAAQAWRLRPQPAAAPWTLPRSPRGATADTPLPLSLPDTVHPGVVQGSALSPAEWLGHCASQYMRRCGLADDARAAAARTANTAYCYHRSACPTRAMKWYRNAHDIAEVPSAVAAQHHRRRIEGDTAVPEEVD
eukprot:gene1591-2498_t